MRATAIPSAWRQSELRRLAFEPLEPRMLLAGDTAPPLLSQPGGPVATISGHVYEVDSSIENTSPADSQSVALARVQLLGGAGAVIEETATAADGSYQFEGLVAGQYGVRQVVPPGYSMFEVRPGSGGGDALDANSVVAISLDWGERLSDYDFSLIVSTQPQISLESPSPGALTLSLQRSDGKASPSLVVNTVPGAAQAIRFDPRDILEPLSPHYRAEFYGGSSERPIAARELPLELEDPAEETFRLVDYLQLVSSDGFQLEDILPVFETDLNSKDGEPTAAESNNAYAESTPTKDGAQKAESTAKRVDASEGGPNTTKVARRPGLKTSAVQPVAAPKKLQESPQAVSKRVAAIDRALETAITAARTAQPG